MDSLKLKSGLSPGCTQYMAINNLRRFQSGETAAVVQPGCRLFFSMAPLIQVAVNLWIWSYKGMRRTESYSLFSNLKYILHELKRFRISGIIISLLEIPAKVMVSLVTIYSPKIVLDAIQKPAAIKEFTLTIFVITIILAAMYLLELYARNTSEHCANTFVLTHMQRI